MTIAASQPATGHDGTATDDEKAARRDEKAQHATLGSDDASSSLSSSVQAQAVVQTSPKRTWRSYFWDTFDKSPAERHFLFKLDAVVLTFASLGYFIKNIDQVSEHNTQHNTLSRIWWRREAEFANETNHTGRKTSAMPTSRA